MCQESSDMAKFGPFKAKIWTFFGQNLAIFWQKLRVLRVFDLLLPNAAMNLSNFWYGSFSNGLP